MIKTRFVLHIALLCHTYVRQRPSFLIRHSSDQYKGPIHVHVTDKTPKQNFWNAICPRNMTIEIHWFMPRFADPICDPLESMLDAPMQVIDNYTWCSGQHLTIIRILGTNYILLMWINNKFDDRHDLVRLRKILQRPTVIRKYLYLSVSKH